MSTNKYVRKIAIVGAAGQVGKYMVAELLKTGKHQVTAVTRADSTSEAPAGVKVAKVDYEDHSSLVEALQGQDVLIITMAVTAPPDTSAKLIKAAADAGVLWVMPNEWGVDYQNESVATDTMIGKPILANRKLIHDLGVSTCISFICGFWYEYSLSTGPCTYGFDFKNQKVIFYDDGKTLTNTSTFPQVGRGVASLLSLKVSPDDEHDQSPCLMHYKDKPVYISSFKISQEDMLDSVLRVTQTKKEDWKITYEGSKERFEAGRKGLQSGAGRVAFAQLLYARLFYPDGSGEFESRIGLDNSKLGLPKEDLDGYTKIAVGWAKENGQLGVE